MAEKTLKDIREDLCRLFDQAVNESRMSAFHGEEKIAKATYMGSAGQIALAIAKIDEMTGANDAKLDVFKSPRP